MLYVHYTSNLNMPIGEDFYVNDNNISNILSVLIKDEEVVSIKVREGSEFGNIVFSTASYESIENNLINEMTYDPNNYLNIA